MRKLSLHFLYYLLFGTVLTVACKKPQPSTGKNLSIERTEDDEDNKDSDVMGDLEALAKEQDPEKKKQLMKKLWEKATLGNEAGTALALWNKVQKAWDQYTTWSREVRSPLRSLADKNAVKTALEQAFKYGDNLIDANATPLPDLTDLKSLAESVHKLQEINDDEGAPYIYNRRDTKGVKVDTADKFQITEKESKDLREYLDILAAYVATDA